MKVALVGLSPFGTPSVVGSIRDYDNHALQWAIFVGLN